MHSMVPGFYPLQTTLSRASMLNKWWWFCMKNLFIWKSLKIYTSLQKQTETTMKIWYNKNREKCIKTLWVVIIHRFLVCDMPINVILRYKMNGNPAKTQREKPHKICHAKRLKNTST